GLDGVVVGFAEGRRRSARHGGLDGNSLSGNSRGISAPNKGNRCHHTPRIVTISLMITPAPANTDAFALRLSVFYGGLFVALGIQMPFLPVWLAAKGLDPNAIGIVLAAPLLLRILAVPVATGAADRLGALRGVLIAAAFATAAGYAALGLAAGFWPLLIMVALASSAFTSIFPLADAYALKGLALRGRPYGSVRLWGSGAFIVRSLG